MPDTVASFPLTSKLVNALDLRQCSSCGAVALAVPDRPEPYDTCGGVWASLSGAERGYWMTLLLGHRFH